MKEEDLLFLVHKNCSECQEVKKIAKKNNVKILDISNSNDFDEAIDYLVQYEVESVPAVIGTVDNEERGKCSIGFDEDDNMLVDCQESTIKLTK